MGQVASIIGTLFAPCDTCSKYVCNAMKCHSKCSECCELDFETEEVTIPSDSDSMSVDCCFGHART